MIRHRFDLQGATVPTHLVNLDALIRRDDLEVTSDSVQPPRRLGDELKVQDLEATYFKLLRKPDFQRETSNWSPEKIVDFVKSFVNGDVIPSIIMWWSRNGTVFVIDGAHRLSALMSWVHDDYGYGNISQDFWGHAISPVQKRLADLTKALMETEIGSYQRLKYLVQHPTESPDQSILLRARNAVTFKIDLQWVEGNAENAEKSFFKINGSPSVIDETELGIIKARRKPNAIATRALMNAGTGHKYWSSFPKSAQEEIESLAKDIYEILFKPILETPIKTTDLPIAGQGYSAKSFRMVFDLVNLVNGITPAMWKERKTKKEKADAVQMLLDDTDGAATVTHLKNVKKYAERTKVSP